MKMSKLLTILVVLTVLLSCASQPHNSPSTPYLDHVVIAYVAGFRSPDFESIDGNKLTHINYAFANISDGRVVEGRPSDSQHFQGLQSLRSRYPHLKILISVGGWSWSDHFSDAALTPESREIFAQSALDFMLKYQLDGVDLDWEYPGQRGEDNVFRAEDKQNFTMMLAAVREKLDAQSEADGRIGPDKYLLTIASGANQRYLDHTEMAEAHQYLDYVNIMTYDYFTGGSSLAGHHTNLFHSSTGEPHRSGAQAVQQHLNAGIPAEKLVLGAAFYGRGWKIDSSEPVLYVPPREPGFSAPYHEILELIDHQGYLRKWDEAAKAPYLWQPDSAIVITYDDPESLSHKCDFVKSSGLAGIMFWEYSHDFNGELLGSIYANLVNSDR